ncbi:hypothetical protein ACFVT5_12040 [Streptomyces sp. NPDC058001]|uniref:hypothetical protein n=1 Tax=Streptomyces sp. NPDC058001 TaxID=3346300 RepID=UPI0036EBDB77
MGGSAKPRRPKAAPAALRYERRRSVPRRGAARTKSGKARRFGFGLLVFLVFAGGIVLLALVDSLWGDDTWRWAADTWPGGAYGFALTIGAVAPCLVALSAWAVSRPGRRSWKTRSARSLGHFALAVVAAAPLLPFVVLAFNAANDGETRRGPSGTPSWAFRHYDWLWAVGLTATVIVTVLLIWVTATLGRRDPGPLGAGR